MTDPTPACTCTFVRDLTCPNPPGPDGLCDYCRQSSFCRQLREASR